MSATIRVRGLRKEFRRRVRPPGAFGWLQAFGRQHVETHTALRGMDFDVAEAQALALIGPNGAGKSTTLKILTGILHPSSGEASVLGLVPWRQRSRLSMNIATVFGQRSQLWFDLPAADSFALLARIYELREREYKLHRDRLIERFELGPLLGTPVRKLSLGQRMRCEIAAALLHRPRVLFLDEPTIGLDVLAKQEIRALIRQLNRDEGVTVVLTSHDAGDIEHLCESVLLINHGSVVFHDRVNVLASRYRRHKWIEVVLERPISVAYPLYYLASACGDRWLRFSFTLLVALALAAWIVGPLALDAGACLAALAAGLLAVAIDELNALGISLSSFWVENTFGLHLLYRRCLLILGGALVPIEAYPEWAAALCRRLPFAQLVGGPARLFVSADASAAPALLFDLTLLAALSAAAVYVIYSCGLRRLVAQGG